MTQQAKRTYVFRRVLLVARFLLLLLLAGFQAVPLSYGSAEQYINQAGLQLARSNGFAKNALLLQHGTADQQTQALSDMQVSLPLFVAEQNTLLKSNRQDMQAALLDARSYYLAIIAAAPALISHPSNVNASQVAIITTNSRDYNIAMNQYMVVLQQQANDFNTRLVLIQEIVLVLIVASSIWLRSFEVATKRGGI